MLLMKRTLAVIALLLLACPAMAGVSFFPRGKSIASATVYADTTKPALYYIMSANGDTLYVRGAISATKDIVQVYGKTGSPNLAHIELYATYLIPSATRNNLHAWRSHPQLTTNGQTSPWFSTNHAIVGQSANVMGFQNLIVPVVTSAGHGKDAGDVGSRWTDGHYFFILAAFTTNTLTFYSIPFAHPTYPIWSLTTAITSAHNLTYVSGTAAHQTDITVTSQAATAMPYSTAGMSLTMRADGIRDIGAAASGYANFISMDEGFNIINPATIDTTNNPWNWADGSVWLSGKQTRILTAGNVATTGTYTMSDSMSSEAIVAAQVFGYGYYARAVWDTTRLYVPKTKATNRWNYSTPTKILSNGADYAGFPGGIVGADSMQRTGDVADRAVWMYTNTGADTMSVSNAVGWYQYPDQIAGVLANARSYYWRLGTTNSTGYMSICAQAQR
jgi:hypothetical protein